MCPEARGSEPARADKGIGTAGGNADAVVAEYEYDARNFRVAKLVPNGENWDRTDYYFNDEWQCLEERLAEGVTTANKGNVATASKVQWLWDQRYVDAPVCRWRDDNADGDMADAGEQLFYSNDANMNVTALMDTTGAVVERYAYDPYGLATIYDSTWTNTVTWDNSKKNEVNYCGYRFDRETGLHTVRHRYYNPATGTWISRDPAGYVDGISAYAALASSPASNSDPEGLLRIDLTGRTAILDRPGDTLSDVAKAVTGRAIDWRLLIDPDTGRPFTEAKARTLRVRTTVSIAPLLPQATQPPAVVDDTPAPPVVDDTPVFSSPSDNFLLAIDGSASRDWLRLGSNGRYNSTIANFAQDYPGDFVYRHGPSMLPSRKAMHEIEDEAVDQVCTRWCKNQQLNIDMIGFSRGGYLVMQAARTLNDKGCCCDGSAHKPIPVRFMGLLDPVKMVAGYGNGENISANVRNVFRVFASASPVKAVWYDENGYNERSRWYFNRADGGRDDPGKTYSVAAWIFATHSAIGGSPWGGDHPEGGHSKANDEAESKRVDTLLRRYARRFGVNVPLWHSGMEYVP